MKYILKAQQRGKCRQLKEKKILKFNVRFKPCYSFSLGIFYDVISSLGIPDVMAVPNIFLKYPLEGKKKKLG